MSVDVRSNPHLHVWTTSMMGGLEYATAIYENKVDASLAFLGIARDVSKYSMEQDSLNIELVMQSLEQGRGMFVGLPGFAVVLTKCDGGCISATWN